MAAEVWNPRHSKNASGWVPLTSDDPWPKKAGGGYADEIHIRDTALAIAGGIAQMGPIQLPWRPSVVRHGADGAAGGAGTVTAGSGVLKTIPKGSAAATTILPMSSTTLETSSPRFSATPDQNIIGVVANPPRDFWVRWFGLTGAATTLSVFAVASRVPVLGNPDLE